MTQRRADDGSAGNCVTDGREVSFVSGDVTLTGTLWVPAASEAVPGVVMVGGSGPSDRNNDVFFPPIREHLLANGIAVLSYDKRGVGGSTGSWVAASIDDFAADATAAYNYLRAEPDVGAVGLYGHSEGGWSVLRAATLCTDVAFVVTNSCPGMSPAVQDRYAVEVALHSAGQSADASASTLSLYDTLIEEARRGTPYDVIQPLLASRSDEMAYFGDPDADDWASIAPKLDHDPYDDIAGLRCALLALFGAVDPLVPVPPSVEIYARAVADRQVAGPTVTIAVFPGADHRLALRDGTLAAGYLRTLTSWIQDVTAAT